jgi:hypothetical protein
MEEGSLDWFRWFYAGRINRPGEMEERWHEDAAREAAGLDA